MGVIHPDVLNSFSATPRELELMRGLCAGFSVNWAARYKKHQAKVTAFIIKPDQFMMDTFGLENQIARMYSSYKEMQDRTMQAANAFISNTPAALGRVDQSLFFIISEDAKVNEWLQEYLSRNTQSRLAISLDLPSLDKKTTDAWALRNTIAKQLFTRNLFDYQLPVESDILFFGRDALVQDIVDAIRKSQNRSIFGLRKTGKTSTLFKVRRVCEDGGIARVFYYDCKLPAISQLSWEDLLWRVIDDITGNQRKRVGHVSDVFLGVVKSLPTSTKLCLMFDEIEWISPLSPFDDHWKKGFIDFWRTLWSVQSQQRKVSIIISGVNAAVTEADKFEGAQNPIFGIVKPFYLKGLDLSELRRMIRFFGRRMGLTFEDSAIEYLYARYGGHPLLIRMACSYVHTQLDPFGGNRPVTVTKSELVADESRRESEIMSYCRHVVSEIRDFYLPEYELLELLARDGAADYWDLQEDPDAVRHIRAYGLVTDKPGAKPEFLIPVLGSYISRESQRKQGQSTQIILVPAAERPHWISRRIDRLISSFRTIEMGANRALGGYCWPGGALPELDRIMKLAPATLDTEFDAFILVMYRNFVEPVYKSGKFSYGVKVKFTEVSSALEKIRVLRHRTGHIKLNNKVFDDVQTILNSVFGQRLPHQQSEFYFGLQQFVLDDLWLAMQIDVQELV